MASNVKIVFSKEVVVLRFLIEVYIDRNVKIHTSIVHHIF